MNNITNKKQMLDSLIENIASISDEEYQQRIWIRAEGPECDDIDDAVCDFFDDGDPILSEYKSFGINEIQYQLLKILHEKLRKFTDTFGVYSPQKSTEKLIHLPEWQEIREISKKVLKSFQRKEN